MATIKVTFRPSSVQGNQGSLVYVITNLGIVRTVTSDYKVFPNEWDKKRGGMKTGLEGERGKECDTISRKVKLDLRQLQMIVSKFELSGIPYLAEDIVEEFQRQRELLSFFKFMGDVIKRLEKHGRYSTSKNYGSTLNSFRTFLNHSYDNQSELDVREITPSLMEEYQAWLKNRDVKANTISFYMRILRATYNRAVKQGLVVDCKPFGKCFTGNEKTVKRALTVSQVKRIKDLDLSSKPKLDQARGIFLFLFSCRGMSPIDAAYLVQKDITKQDIIYRRNKTNQLMMIGLNRYIRGLLEDIKPANSQFLLPILRDGAQGRREYESALKRLNRQLKEVGRLAKIPIPLTTYVSRHSWASIAKAKGIPTSVIADALGHESELTTRIYLASISNKEIDKVNERILREL